MTFLIYLSLAFLRVNQKVRKSNIIFLLIFLTAIKKYLKYIVYDKNTIFCYKHAKL